MDSQDFNEIMDNRINRIREILSGKAKEYAVGGDRLHNFTVAARIADTTRENVLYGMMMKHLVSVIDLIEKPEMQTPYLIDEKIGDLVNYLILLEAVMIDRLKTSQRGGEVDGTD